MSTLGWLINRLDRISPEEIGDGPKDPVAEDEEVVAVLEDEEIRKLWILLSRTKDEENRLLSEFLDMSEDHDLDHTVSSCDICKKRIELAIATCRCQILEGMFWVEVRESIFPGLLAHQLTDGQGVGMREGWQIVFSQIAPEPIVYFS